MKNLPEAVATDSCMMIIVLCMMFAFILNYKGDQLARTWDFIFWVEGKGMCS